MRKHILNRVMFVAGLAAPLLGLTGCSAQGEGEIVSSTSQAVLLSPPRQHYEVTDPQDGLFVTYWERYYDKGTASMDLFANGYTSKVDYTGVTGSPQANSVTGKGKNYCWGDVIDWKITAESNVTSMRVYGWQENPLVEYYIGRGPEGGEELSAGIYNTSRGRYELHVKILEQENILNPDGTGPIKKFLQYNVTSLDGADAKVGPVNLTEHFAGWESLMSTFWPAQTNWISRGWSWNPLKKANYCVVATELWGNNTVGNATVTNISVTPTACQIVDGSCDGKDSDCDGKVDEDYPSSACKLPASHPTCAGAAGMSTCSSGAESCVPNVAGTPDRCDGVDNDCDGTIDEDPIPEEACNGLDDDCDGKVDEGSINLPVRCVLDKDDDGIEDGLDLVPGTFSNKFAEPNFGNTTGEIIDRGDQIVAVLDPFSDAGVWIETLPNRGPKKAKISLCGGTVNLTMGPGEQQVVTCPKTSCLFASQQLKMLDRGQAWSDFYAGSFVMQWDAKVYGKGLSAGDGNLFDRAKITGGAKLVGTLTGNRAGASPLVEHATVPAQVLTVFPIVATDSIVSVPENGTTTLSPGDYGDVTVAKGGTLVLSASGTYRFRSLAFGIDTKLNLTAAATNQVVLAIEGNLTIGDNFRVLGNPNLDIYANGTSVAVGYDVILSADIQAPSAAVEVKDRTQFNGCIGGRNVTLGYDIQLHGNTWGSPPVLSAKLTKTGDWGGDYCATIDVTNSGGSSTGWTATINTNGSSIYNTWNGTYAGTSGTVTAKPNQTYNVKIDPGKTDTSVGFCAHRSAAGQMATIVSIVPN